MADKWLKQQLDQTRLNLKRIQIIVNHRLTLVPLIMVILALLWELGLMRMVNQLQLTQIGRASCRERVSSPV